MKISPEEISSIIREQIANFDTEVEVKEVGTVLSVGDGKPEKTLKSSVSKNICPSVIIEHLEEPIFFTDRGSFQTILGGHLLISMGAKGKQITKVSFTSSSR